MTVGDAGEATVDLEAGVKEGVQAPTTFRLEVGLGAGTGIMNLAATIGTAETEGMMIEIDAIGTGTMDIMVEITGSE